MPQKDGFGLKAYNSAYQSKGVVPSKQGGAGYLNYNRTQLVEMITNVAKSRNH